MLETLDGLKADDCITISPPGPFLGESASRGYKAIAVGSAFELLRALIRLLRLHDELILLTTTVTQAFMAGLVNLFFRRRVAHLHIVHGGDDDYSSYGRKKWLNWINVSQIAVSKFVRDKLIQNGVKPSSVFVIENFLCERTQRQIRKKRVLTASEVVG